MDSTDSTLHGGTGLGLAICWGLCQAMGGTIQLESEPGRGSRFQVDIPFDPASPADSLPMGVPRTASQALATPLLIVGLHPLVRQALALQCSALQYWGSQVPVEAAVIDATLDFTKGNITQASKMLGVTRRQLSYRLNRQGVDDR
jgi:hypothetical protein